MPGKKSATGFTLLELLVAIAIFSFLATAAFTAINQIIIEREIVTERAALLHDLQRTVRYLNTDFSQLHPRSVRDELGRDRIPALSNNPGQDFEIRLTREGWRNPTRKSRGTLQRVMYRMEDDMLIREYWPVVDHLLGEEPRKTELLEGIEDIRIAFLDQSGEWNEDWPPAEAPDRLQGLLPTAVRYRFTLDNFGLIERIVEIPQ